MASAERDGTRLPQLRLDELLDELQARLDAARGTRDRVHSLLEAVLSVGRELDLEQVLRRVTETAVALVDAEYGALGVLGPDGRKIVHFLPVGMTGKQIAAIGPYPSGHGVLGELIRHPEPLRLSKVSQHPSSYGFPAHHPPMHTFLGVPIRVRDEVFGNLYLTEKRGGAEFDAEDESVLSTLAVAAGMAIDNARLYEEARRRERWQQAGGEITASLLSGSPQSEVIGLIAGSAKDIADAELAVVALPMPNTSTLVIELALGKGAEAHRGLVLPAEGSLIGAAFSAATPLTSADICHDARETAAPERLAGLGPTVAVPIGTGTGVRGVLLLARASDGTDFTTVETEQLTGFAGQAAVAMELADRRRDAEQIATLEDHDRIARDLHDLAIQRLFAMGMTLQSAARIIEHPDASERVLRTVGDLDETIKIIRSTIFGLRLHEHDEGHGLRTRVVQTAGEATAALGFAPGLRMEGLLDTQVPREIADHVVAVLSEALTNIARHAQATRADVVLKTGGEDVVLTVSDNGVGIPPDGRRSGLRNLSERAGQLGGALELSRPLTGGTTLTWHVPLSAPQ
ncbi:putative two-component histidine kinase [Streptomyces sp. NBRC 110611]|uniref:GAF domain-containing sensor histidine kinase n=1 Tax=Streptomyces sp. NBRC 110611 TaxID=1621259 RepID=UPI00082CA827|nr:GAF domain-containing protein [Streptomyces sp. NBRC 110611]GAU70517.1 putative two-component histidine kinase [Streptomyces sp. NBRC 110611]